MGKKSIDDRLNIFETNLLALKNINILKYDDILNKTKIMTDEIKRQTDNYSSSQDIYKKFNEYLLFCESIISYYESLPCKYFKHWIGDYKIRGI